MNSRSSSSDAVQAAWQAFEARGYEGILDWVDPEVEWIDREGRVYHGREELEAFVDGLRENGVTLEPRSYSFEEHGPWVLVAGGLRTRSSKGLADVPRYWIYCVEDGRLKKMASFSSRDEALNSIEAALA